MECVSSTELFDFGLAKAGPQGDETHVFTRVMGTYGYAAPEYVMTGITSKFLQLPFIRISSYISILFEIQSQLLKVNVFCEMLNINVWQPSYLNFKSKKA